ncbi:MAG: ribosome-associated translation inhibitor RaiA [Dehalococcoidia bacterium]
MDLTVRSHHASIDDGFRDHAEKKLGRLERLLPRIGDVIVEVEHEETRAASHRYSVQVTVHAGGSVLRAEEHGPDARVALDLVSEVLLMQARRHKQRLQERNRGPGGKEAIPPAASAPTEGDGEDDEVLDRIVRVKHFEAKPMPPEEALAQMDLLGHDFFLFLDAETDDYALLYRRRNGDVGMLSPRRA